jgi:hypothetical protein
MSAAVAISAAWRESRNEHRAFGFERVFPSKIQMGFKGSLAACSTQSPDETTKDRQFRSPISIGFETARRW